MAVVELDEASFRVGRRLLELADGSRTWIARRIEHIEFDDHQAMRKVTIFDLSFDEMELPELPRLRGRTVLPIKLIRRDLDLDATVFDLDGRALPQLNRRLERTLVAAGLVAIAMPHEPLDVRITAAAWLRHVLDPESFALPDAQPDPTALAAVEEDLLRFRTLRLLIAALDLPHDGEVGGAIMRVTVSQSEAVPIEPERAAEGKASSVPAARRVGNAIRHPIEEARTFIRSELSWEQLAVPTTDDFVLSFQLDEASSCESFHFELVAPPGSVVKSALFELQSIAPEQMKRFDELKGRLAELDPIADAEAIAACYDEIRQVASSSRSRSIRDDDVHFDRVHLFASLDNDEEVIHSNAEILLRPMTMGTTRSGVYSSILATVALVGLWLTIAWSGAPNRAPKVWSANYDVDRQSVVALLLLGPTLFLASVIREREHLMTKRILERHRRRLVLQAILTFTTAAIYALGPSSGTRWWVSVPVVIASVVLSSIEIRSYLRSWRTLRAQERLSTASVMPIGGG